MDPSALRNFKDFLQLYNKMTEICFTRCIDNTNSRNLDNNEIDCVDECSSKFVKFNNKLMQNFVNAQTDIVNKRMEDAEKQQRLDAEASNPVENQLENNESAVAEQKRLENNDLRDKENVHTEIAVSQ